MVLKRGDELSAKRLILEDSPFSSVKRQGGTRNFLRKSRYHQESFVQVPSFTKCFRHHKESKAPRLQRSRAHTLSKFPTRGLGGLRARFAGGSSSTVGREDKPATRILKRRLLESPPNRCCSSMLEATVQRTRWERHGGLRFVRKQNIPSQKRKSGKRIRDGGEESTKQSGNRQKPTFLP